MTDNAALIEEDMTDAGKATPTRKEQDEAAD